jgi:hypothetical protein
MRHGGITGFEVKIGQDSGISEPGTGPFLLDCEVYETVHELVASHCFLSKYDISIHHQHLAGIFNDFIFGIA